MVGELKVRIDRTLCVGFGDCVEAAPEVFDLDDDDVAVFMNGHGCSRDRLIEACGLCPVDALMVWDEKGNQVVP
jgi:ferredoxin